MAQITVSIANERPVSCYEKIIDKIGSTTLPVCALSHIGDYGDIKNITL